MGQERDIQLGKYHLKSRLGKGGMGVVYLATDSRLKRDVAVKVLPRSMSSNPTAVKRFLREARVAASISHPSVVTIHDVDQIDGHCFLVMELMTGGTAQDKLTQGPLDWREATRIISDTCQGLAAIHDAGLIHRDIKPSNIMLAAKGAVKLADFGLAKLTDTTAESKPLTLANSILGTPQYMSPEQCQGDELDSRCDVYSLGATYFALLTGGPPFPDPQPLQCMFAHCSLPVPDPRGKRAEIPAESVAIIMKAMAKQRSDRFASAREMSAALQACLSSHPITPTSPPSSAKTAPGTVVIQPPDSGTVATASDEPGAATFPPIDPRQTTVIMQDGRRRPFDRPRTALIAGGCLLVLFAALAIWTMNGGTKPGKNGVATAGPGSSGSPGATQSPARPKPGNAPTGLQFVAEFPGHTNEVYGVAFASDGKSFFSGSRDGTVRQWDIASRQQVRTFEGISQGIQAIATHQNWLAAGGEGKTVWLWNVNSSKPLREIAGFRETVSALAFSPDGTRFAIGTYSELNLYRLDDSGPVLLKQLGNSSSKPIPSYMVESVCFSSDSRWVAAPSWENKTVAVWDAKTGDLRDFKQQLGDNLMGVSFVPGEDRLLFTVDSAGVFVWDLKDRVQSQPALLRESRLADSREVRPVAVTPDGRYAAAVGEWGGGVWLYDVQQAAKTIAAIKSVNAKSIGLDISPDGSLLVVCGGEKDQEKNAFIHLWKIVRERSE